MRCGPPMCPVDKLLSLKDVGSSFWPPRCMMVLRPCTIETYVGNVTYASAQALVSHPWRPSYYRSDRSTMPMSNKIILRSSSTLSLCSPYIRISSNFFQAVANTIPFFFLFSFSCYARLFLACESHCTFCCAYSLWRVYNSQGSHPNQKILVMCMHYLREPLCT